MTQTGINTEILFEDPHNSFVLLDPNFNFIHVNETYARENGQSVDFFRGKNHFILYPSNAKKIFEQARDTKKEVQLSANSLGYSDCPAGQSRDRVWTVDPILNDAGEIDSFVLTNIELPESKYAAQSLLKDHLLLAAVSQAQKLYIRDEEPTRIFDD